MRPRAVLLSDCLGARRDRHCASAHGGRDPRRCAGAGGNPDPVAAVRRVGHSPVAFMNQERFVGIVVGMTTVAVTLATLAFFEREAVSKVAYDCVDPTERERVRDIALRGI